MIPDVNIGLTHVHDHIHALIRAHTDVPSHMQTGARICITHTHTVERGESRLFLEPWLGAVVTCIGEDREEEYLCLGTIKRSHVRKTEIQVGAC